MMLSLPSPAPTLCAIGTLGTLKPASALAPPPPPPPPLSLPPHPAAAKSAAHATAAAHVPRLIMVLPPPRRTALPRSRTSGPRASRLAPAARAARGRRPTTSRGSVAPPAALLPRRARRDSA